MLKLTQTVPPGLEQMMTLTFTVTFERPADSAEQARSAHEPLIPVKVGSP